MNFPILDPGFVKKASRKAKKRGHRESNEILCNNDDIQNQKETDVPKEKKKKKSQSKVTQNEEILVEVDGNHSSMLCVGEASPPEEENIKKQVHKKLKHWSRDELITLIKKVDNAIANNEAQKYSHSLKTLNWEAIRIGRHNGAECKDVLKRLIHKIRKYRTLKEVLADAKASIEKGEITKSIKPPTLRTPFVIFMEENQQNKGITEKVKKYYKEIREEWNSLPDKMKLKYIKEAVNEYIDLLKISGIPEKEKDLLTKEERRLYLDEKKIPKLPPKSPLHLFTTLKKKEIEGMSFRDRMKKIQLMWRKLSAEDKKQYDLILNDKKKKYMEHVKQLSEEEKYILKVKDIRNASEKKSYPGQPQKPPKNGSALFFSEIKDSLRSMTSRERMIESNRQWKMLPELEKQKYVQMAKEANERFKEELKKFLLSLSPEEFCQYKKWKEGEKKARFKNRKVTVRKDKKKLQEGSKANARRSHIEVKIRDTKESEKDESSISGISDHDDEFSSYTEE